METAHVALVSAGGGGDRGVGGRWPAAAASLDGSRGAGFGAGVDSWRDQRCAVDGAAHGVLQPPHGPPIGVAELQPYLDHTDLRDDRVFLYAGSLPAGTYTYTYLAQATLVGSYAVAATHAVEAFFPEVFGRSAGQQFTVR